MKTSEPRPTRPRPVRIVQPTRPRNRASRSFVVRPLAGVLLALGALSFAACSGSAAMTATGTGTDVAAVSRTVVPAA